MNNKYIRNTALTGILLTYLVSQTSCASSKKILDDHSQRNGEQVELIPKELIIITDDILPLEQKIEDLNKFSLKNEKEDVVEVKKPGWFKKTYTNMTDSMAGLFNKDKKSPLLGLSKTPEVLREEAFKEYTTKAFGGKSLGEFSDNIIKGVLNSKMPETIYNLNNFKSEFSIYNNQINPLTKKTFEPKTVSKLKYLDTLTKGVTSLNNSMDAFLLNLALQKTDLKENYKAFMEHDTSLTKKQAKKQAKNYYEGILSSNKNIGKIIDATDSMLLNQISAMLNDLNSKDMFYFTTLGDKKVNEKVEEFKKGSEGLSEKLKAIIGFTNAENSYSEKHYGKLILVDDKLKRIFNKKALIPIGESIVKNPDGKFNESYEKTMKKIKGLYNNSLQADYKTEVVKARDKFIRLAFDYFALSQTGEGDQTNKLSFDEFVGVKYFVDSEIAQISKRNVSLYEGVRNIWITEDKTRLQKTGSTIAKSGISLFKEVFTWGGPGMAFNFLDNLRYTFDYDKLNGNLEKIMKGGVRADLAIERVNFPDDKIEQIYKRQPLRAAYTTLISLYYRSLVGGAKDVILGKDEITIKPRRGGRDGGPLINGKK